MSIVEREKRFYDGQWEGTQVRRIRERLAIPTVPSLAGKRVLICSCGSGVEPVMAANAGAEVWAFDISETGVAKAREMAAFNGVQVRTEVMDFHHLAYPDAFFDCIFGSCILHHVDCAVAGREVRRCLKPGGVAFFRENSDRNPLFRFLRQKLFGTHGTRQRQRFLFLRRTGTEDEYPLTEGEVALLAGLFDGHMQRFFPRFDFFYLLYLGSGRKPWLGPLCSGLDTALGTLFPFLKPYSYFQELLFTRVDGS